MKKSKVVPRLQFPEFKGDQWNSRSLGKIAPLQRGFDLPTTELRFGNIPVVYSNGVQRFHHKGMATAPGLVTGRSGTIGKLHFIESGEYWPHNTSLWVTSFEGNIPKFVYFLFDFIDVGQFASGSGVPTLNRNDVHAFLSAVPQSLAEQQKIADCLSSIDELISAEARKLDALKAHKKGLMQQLFPAEGETVPRLRFPEFQDAGEWQIYELGALTSKVGSGITPSGGDKNYKTEGRPFVRSQNIGWGELILDDMVFIDEEMHRSFVATEIKEFDVLLNITGASIGRSAVADLRIAGGNVNQHVCIIRVEINKLNPIFLNQFLISELGQKQIDSFQAGGNRQGLNFAQIRSFGIPLPSTEVEQGRIADFLLSLDSLIVDQGQKLARLKKHKRGLMQQLFPVVDDFQE